MRTPSPNILHAKTFLNSLENFIDIFHERYGFYLGENEPLMLAIESIGNIRTKKNNRHIEMDQELPHLLKVMPFVSTYNGILWKVLESDLVEVEDYSLHNLFMGLLDDRFYNIVPDGHFAEKKKIMVPICFTLNKNNELYASGFGSH